MSDYDFFRRTEQGAVAPSATHTLEAIVPQPTLRIRVEHSRTIKDGWGYSTTVELDGSPATGWDDVEAAGSLIKIALMEARELGEYERDFRNKRDTAAKEATAPIASTAS